VNVPRRFDARILCLTAAVLVGVPVTAAEAVGHQAPRPGVVVAEGADVVDFVEVCRRAKAAGLRGKLLETERSMFLARSGSGPRSAATVMTEAILDRRRRIAAFDNAHAAAITFCTARNLARQTALVERIESLLLGICNAMDAIEAAGGVAGTGRTEFERQADACRQRRIDIDARREAELRALVSLLDAGDVAVVLPGDGPEVPECVDASKEIDVAIAHRLDLETIDIVQRNVCRDTLPVVRRFLALSDPAIGLNPPPGGTTGHGLRKTSVDTAPMELRLRKQQLDDLRRQRAGAIRLDVCNAVGQLQSAQERRRIAREAVDRNTQRRDRLARSADGQGVTALTLKSAELDELSAHQQLLECELAVELAYVQLLAARHAL
jgi:hypothetical protein